MSYVKRAAAMVERPRERPAGRALIQTHAPMAPG
jgi:hypothetical protein